MVKSRNTWQKELLLKNMEKFNSFFTAQELLIKANKEDSKLGIATVYRFLKDLTKKQEIHSYVCDRKIIYSLNKKSHCHFICERTGKVIHFELDNLDFLKKIRDKIPGEINSISIEVSGICKSCK